jgi:alkanesulfonate monooxygenase SsuD/methylene tetrahydromethanopterin reductase-like flavin-dependent oxidoreductase (luciferase family)
MTSPSMHLAVALDGAGWHPAAWRDPSARASELFTARYWADLAHTAERGLLDFLTIDDSFSQQSSRFGRLDERTDQVRGRLDAVLVASLLAPHTRHIGLVPTGNTTLTEPFHIASAISTLDYLSHGRAGWRPQVSGRADEAAMVGTRPVPAAELRDRSDPAVHDRMLELFDEADEVVEVVRRLWDSWEDDAIIKDVATGRYIDREKLHYIDFEGRSFSVKGPSIVPRPPQGQPVIAALAHQEVPFRFAARSADVVFVTPADRDDVARWVGSIRAAEQAVDRHLPPLRTMADVVVVLDPTPGAAERRLRWLDELDGFPLRSDAAIVTGTPASLADELEAWRGAGLDGFRLRPAVITHDLEQVTDGLVPILRDRGAFRSGYVPGETLRDRLGLPRPENRYAPAADAPSRSEVVA